MINGDLTDKQRRFIDEYLIDLNATQAAIRAGYSERSAKEIACGLLTKHNIINEVMRRQEERQKRTEVTQDMVVQELARIAFLDLDVVYDEDKGTLLDKIKLVDKIRALDLLGKHMKMFTDKVDLNVSGTLTMADAIRQRDAKTDI